MLFTVLGSESCQTLFRDSEGTAMNRSGVLLVFLGVSTAWICAERLSKVHQVEGQPFVAQVVRLSEAMTFLGSSLRDNELQRIRDLKQEAPSAMVVTKLQEILDPYCIAMVDINPEARVKVHRGPAQPRLIQGGWTSFLVKVHNQAQVNSALVVESPNGLPLLHKSTGAKRMKAENAISSGEVASRFLDLSLYTRRPMAPRLSGLKLEYLVLQIYSRDEGLREAKIGFHVGQGTQDRTGVQLTWIKAHDGSPTMASFIITDGIERIVEDPEINPLPGDYRHALALKQPWDKTRGIGDTPVQAGRLVGVYPLPSRRSRLLLPSTGLSSRRGTRETASWNLRGPVWSWSGVPPSKQAVDRTGGSADARGKLRTSALGAHGSSRVEECRPPRTRGRL